MVIYQDLQQVMVSGPNLNETSIVSGGYGGPAGGIIPTSSIKGTAQNFRLHASQVLACSPFLHNADSWFIVHYSGVRYTVSVILLVPSHPNTSV